MGRVQKYLRNGNYANQIGTAGAVYLTGVLEYLVAEILELSGAAANDNKRVRIIPRHIMLAIKNDSELNELLKGAYFSEGGVMPNINPVLTNKSKPKKAVQQEESQHGENDVTTMEDVTTMDEDNVDENEETEEDEVNEEDEENEEDEDGEEDEEDEEDEEEEEDDEEDEADASAVVGSQNY